MRIAVIGLGLIGGSIAKALKANTEHKVFGFDASEDTLLDALSLGAVDGIATPSSLATMDVVYICLYPEAAVDYAAKNGEKFSKSCVVTDVCGVKSGVCGQLSAIAAEHGFTYVGGHPMAGKEQSGFSASEPGLFMGASYILVPGEAPETAVETLAGLAESMGFGRVIRTTEQKHDRMIAYTSQVPHVLACAYVMSPRCDEHSGFSAGSYRDVSRVARINAELWADLFLANRTELADETGVLIRNIESIRDAVQKGDREQLVSLLETARQKKEQFG